MGYALLTSKIRRAGREIGRRELAESVKAVEASEEALRFGVLGESVNHLFSHEIANLAKNHRIPHHHIKIVDHPCGEYVIFIKENGEDVFFGYLS